MLALTSFVIHWAQLGLRPGRLGMNTTKDGQENRLLPGEDPETPYVDDVEHWCAVYQTLVAEARERHAAVGGLPAQGGDPSTPEQLASLGRHMQQLEDRLAFWLDRQSRFGAGEPPAEAFPAG